jgi:hypothetical protein
MSRYLARIAASAIAATLLAGCGGASLNLWPFKKDSPSTEPAGTVSAPIAAAEPVAAPAPAPAPAPVMVPVVAATYLCDGGRRIQLRPLEGGAAWLTLPEREVRLEKAPSSLNRYVAGRVALELGEKTATVADGPVNYVGCKMTTPGS